MKIKLLNLIEGAKKATGLTVVIDVFRAFSVVCYMFENGVEAVIPVGDIETARILKKSNPSYLLVGEREGKKLEDFDYGNSPSEFEYANLEGKTVIHTTSAGTQGLVNAKKADEIITGSFVNINAVINYIRKKRPRNLSLVSMGEGGVKPAQEDELCALYIRNILCYKDFNFSKIRKNLRRGNGSKFFDKNYEQFPERDFSLCMRLNWYHSVIKAFRYTRNLFILKKQGV